MRGVLKITVIVIAIEQLVVFPNIIAEIVVEKEITETNKHISINNSSINNQVKQHQCFHVSTIV
jgi:hypothetical protein